MTTHDAQDVITDATVMELADELWDADRKAAPIQPLTARYPDLVIEDAYAIQSHNIERRIGMGAHVIGRKVGLTSKPMQQLLGVDEPDYGVLLDDMVVEDGDIIALSSLVQPRVEAEMAFLMERDLTGPGVTTAKALAAIAGVLPAIEVVDSRVADWKIKLVDTVADNALLGAVRHRRKLRSVTEWTCRWSVWRSAATERSSTPCRSGGARQPARCVAWLANKLASFGPVCAPVTSCCGCGPQDGRRAPGDSFAPTSPESDRSPHDSRRTRHFTERKAWATPLSRAPGTAS
jgi:2-keto-4-pentenoate hydratase